MSHIFVDILSSTSDQLFKLDLEHAFDNSINCAISICANFKLLAVNMIFFLNWSLDPKEPSVF